MSHLANVLKFGWPYLRKYWARFFLGVVLGVIFGVSNAGVLWVTNTLVARVIPAEQKADLTAVTAKAPSNSLTSSSTVDSWRNDLDRNATALVDPWLPAIGKKIDWQQVIGCVLLLPMVMLARGYLGYLSSYFMAWASERVVSDLRVNVLEHISSLSMDYFNRAPIGDLVTRVSQDTAALQRTLSLGLSDLIKEPVTIVSIFAMLLFTDWQLTLVAFVFFPFCVLPIVVLGRKVRKAATSGRQTTVVQASLLIEILQGIRVVKAFNQEGSQTDRFRRLSLDLVNHTMRGVRAKELMNPLIETVGMMGLGFVIVYIVWTNRTFADMVPFLGLVFIYTPVKRMANLHALFQITAAGVERLMQVFSEKPTVVEPASPKPLLQFSREFRFENVSFAYGKSPVLNGVDITIPKGRRVGIVGESGSGKSTIINLCFRFYDPTAGRVTIDGLDLREITSASLREQMAFVSQGIVIFDQTVAENIAGGRAGATRAEVESAAKAAFAHEFIIQLPQGYETRVGERGQSLSGGQRQRLAIARAFVRNAPILVLDEATASLDSQSEQEVQVAIDRLEENRTVLCVAHRLSTLRNMDEIVVLSKDGRIIERGTFDALLAANGVFAGMAKAQGIAPGQ